MSQGIPPTINPATTSGTQLASLLNDLVNAYASGNSGTSRPAELDQYGSWVDTTDAGTNIIRLRFFDGTNDVLFATLNTSTGIFSVAGSDSQFDISKSSDDAVGALVRFYKERPTGDQTLSGDTIGGSHYYATSDVPSDVKVAEHEVVVTENTTNAARGSMHVWKAVIATTASVIEMMRLVDKKLGIGITSVLESLHTWGNIRGENTADTTDPASLILRKKRVAGLGQVLSGDRVSSVSSKSVDVAGTEFEGASVEVEATESHTAAARGTKMVFATIDATTTSKTDKVTLAEQTTFHTDKINQGFDYYGPIATDGTFRVGIVSGAFVVQKRVSGTYTTVQELT